ncbi:hypothetical protein VSR01_10885 [Actinacidiphila sp. DG2A-62]|uniref:hypothetical protein n=1 Tax=Actinacidiphila sp. DG2A-62 TaxID=3108821 RepID=UPI002DBC933D|nr:hypothetical protein [Actinacidiphila sp. DG2A-62]MEC3994024.1 hypothetical protein [Actinacidiphila sp. DG2A-62]
MSAQRLGPKALRRIARATDLDIVRGWAWGGYTLYFVTADHQHGWFDKKTGEWGWDESPQPHYSSCAELFPTP